MIKWLLMFLLIPIIALGAVDFEQGSAEYLSQNDGLSTDISGADQHISFFIRAKLESDTGSQQWIIGKFDSATGNRQYGFFTDTSEAVLFILNPVGNDGGQNKIASTTSSVFSYGTEFSAGATYDDTDMRVYVDGSLISNGASNPFTYSSGIFSGSASLAIGAIDGDSPSSYTDGVILDLCIWDSAITATEHALMDASKVKGICKQIQPANLQMYCAFDSCADGTMCSASFNCYPGSPMTIGTAPDGIAETVLTYP